MKQFHVTYYYNATGMEGNPDTKDYGYINANTGREACEQVAARVMKHRPEWEYKFMLGCLTAKEVS